ncbi:hypothetical protein [Halpernia sp.]|uniref:hypothetical protein n=1 Tax=Halpernia sp. TaxID=2782209 RepID=UPI003A90FADF
MFLIYKKIHFKIPELIKLLPNDQVDYKLYVWKIIDDKIYLSNDDLLNSSEIFSKWVNAKLSLKINPALNYNRKYKGSFYYESAVIVFKIRNGEIVEKYIQIVPKSQELNPHLYSDNLISFKEQSFTWRLEENFKLLLREEFEKFKETKTLGKIKELVTSIRSEYFNNTSKPSFDFFQQGGSMTDLLVDQLLISVGPNFIFIYPQNIISNKYQELLNLYFQYVSEVIDNSDNVEFENLGYYYKPNKFDTEFVLWANQNLKWFVLSPTFFINPILTRQYISVKKVRDVFFEYKIQNTTLETNEFLTNDDIRLNFNKINLNYNSEENSFNYCVTRDKLFFDILLSKSDEINEEIINNIEYDTESEELTYKTERDYSEEYYNQDYEPNDNNWLRDAAGTDNPETMNDAFWNLD